VLPTLLTQAPVARDLRDILGYEHMANLRISAIFDRSRPQSFRRQGWFAIDNA
jgi:hypothetical protein